MDIRASTMVQALLFVALSVGSLNDARAADPCPYCTAKYHTCISRGNPQAVCDAQGIECMEQYCGISFTPPAKAFDKTRSLINPGYKDKSLVAAISDQPTMAAPH